MERGALVTEALLASAESLEVGSGLGDNVIEQVEVDAALLFCTVLCQQLEGVIIWR